MIIVGGDLIASIFLKCTKLEDLSLSCKIWDTDQLVISGVNLKKFYYGCDDSLVDCIVLKTPQLISLSCEVETRMQFSGDPPVWLQEAVVNAKNSHDVFDAKLTSLLPLLSNTVSLRINGSVLELINNQLTFPLMINLTRLELSVYSKHVWSRIPLLFELLPSLEHLVLEWGLGVSDPYEHFLEIPDEKAQLPN